MVCVNHILCICSSAQGKLGLLPPLAIVNNAVILIGVQITAWVSAFSPFRHVPGSGIPGSYTSSLGF